MASEAYRNIFRGKWHTRAMSGKPVSLSKMMELVGAKWTCVFRATLMGEGLGGGSHMAQFLVPSLCHLPGVLGVFWGHMLRIETIINITLGQVLDHILNSLGSGRLLFSFG